MKTVFIFDSCGNDNIKFVVADGDYSRLDNIYLNAYYDPDLDSRKVALQDELEGFLYSHGEVYDEESETDWHDNVEYLDEWPKVDEPFIVVRIGCIP